MLALYRAGLRLRRSTPGLGDGDLTWIPSSGSVLAFARGNHVGGNHFICLVNFGADAVDLPDGADVLLASSELEGGALPHDSTAWLRQANPHSIG
jgi:alpha-glucosidase